jgi:hypothetical protein
MVQGDSGSLLLDAITVTLRPALALVDHGAWRELQDHPRSALAARCDRLIARLESLFNAAAGRTLETIERHWVSNPCQPSTACRPSALGCGGSSCTHRRSEHPARCRACTGCNTRRERRLGACQAHGYRQACTGARSLLCSARCAVHRLWLNLSAKQHGHLLEERLPLLSVDLVCVVLVHRGG